MAKKTTKGNPRSTFGARKVTSDVAKSRTLKKAQSASTGNPRAKNINEPKEIEGFKRIAISEIESRTKEQKSIEGRKNRKRAIVEEKNTTSKKLKRIKRSKNLSKETREKRRVNKKRIVVFIFLFLIVCSIATFVYLANSSVFEIEEVEYVGADHLTQSECEALAPSPKGENLLVFDSKKIEESFKRDSWVDGVEFVREFPHKLKIVIKERKIGAVVDFNSGANQTSQSWIVTLDGIWIMGLPDEESDVGKMISTKIFEDADSSVHIKDCPNGVAPEIAKKCTDETVLNALQILSEFSTDLKDEVSSISVSSINATTLQLTNNVEIAFGVAENVREKERIAKEIMEENDKVVYINVRSIDRPTWRSANT